MGQGEGDVFGRLVSGLSDCDPVTAVRLADANRAVASHPDLVGIGTLFAAAEHTGDGWRIVTPYDPVPQGARELLADEFADRLSEPETGPAARQELRAALRRLLGQPADALTVLGVRYRIMRVEQLVRCGPAGPEPPRPSDGDPHPSRPLPSPPGPELHDPPTADMVLPDATRTELLCQVLDAAAGSGREPSGAYLTPVALAPAFTVAERSDGRWRPTGQTHESPGLARGALATYLRHILPAVEGSGFDLAECREAAALLDGARPTGIRAAGRRFRIVRIEQITLFGPDGPEPPRPEDPDVA